MKIGAVLPQAAFHIRVRDESVSGPNPYRWQVLGTDDYFKGRRAVLFAVPGAFTPTCSTHQLPGFEKLADKMRARGVDAIYCLSVNDGFVMDRWAQAQGLRNVRMIPDGSGRFTEAVGMLVRKDNLGLGARSWRYAAVVEDGVILAWFEEPGRVDDCPDDPYGETAPERVMDWLEEHIRQAA